MNLLHKLGTIIIFLFVHIQRSVVEGLQNNPDVYYEILATKSPYFSRPNTSAHQQFLWDLSVTPEGYEPLHLDALHRHGTRFPSTEKLKVFKTTLYEVQAMINSPVIDQILKSWNTYFPFHRNYTLHEKGWYEMFELADTLFDKAGNIFNHIHEKKLNEEESSFLVLASHKSRVLASAKAFLTRIRCQLEKKVNEDENMCKIFDENDVLMSDEAGDTKTVNYSGFPVYINDRLLRSFDYCKQYDHTVKKNKSANHEFVKFFESSSSGLDEVLLTTSDSNAKLNKKQALALYRVCIFMVALHDDASICDLFTKEHLKALEYSADLLHYYKTGHGYSINYRLSCRLLRDILERVEGAVARHTSGEIRPSVVLRFGHAETLIPLLCLIGLYNDKIPLTAANYEFLQHQRMFRTGTFSPFAGNVVFVLYKSTTDSLKPLKMSIIVNGYLVKLSPAQECYFCDYESFRTRVASSLDDFHCESVCKRQFRDEL